MPAPNENTIFSTLLCLQWVMVQCLALNSCVSPTLLGHMTGQENTSGISASLNDCCISPINP